MNIPNTVMRGASDNGRANRGMSRYIEEGIRSRFGMSAFSMITKEGSR